MATTIAITCPKCENQIKAPAELAGKKIRCKECQHVFVVKAPPEEPPSGRKPVPAKKPAKAKPAAKTNAQYDEEDADGKNPYAVTHESLLPRCPYCAKELENDEQVICLNCGYNRRTRERIATEKTMEPTGGEWFIHLLPGIVCALVTLSILVGIPLDFVLRSQLEAEHAEDTINIYGLGVTIWRSVLWAFIGFLCGKFAVKRLILHTRPPERKMQTRKK